MQAACDLSSHEDLTFALLFNSFLEANVRQLLHLEALNRLAEGATAIHSIEAVKTRIFSRRHSTDRLATWRNAVRHNKHLHQTLLGLYLYVSR
jgi:hypothetical protein